MPTSSPSEKTRDPEPKRSPTSAPNHSTLLGVRVDVSTCRSATEKIVKWSAQSHGYAIFACNVHMLTEAAWDAEFGAVLREADLVVPDGMPLVWLFRATGATHAERVYGPQLMLDVCEHCAVSQTPIALIGSTESVMRGLMVELTRRFPTLKVVCALTPTISADGAESEEALRAIGVSGARVVFVAFGCPKQEKWIHSVKDKTSAVMIGVGAAFDFIAGTKLQAPGFIQAAGCEWLFRLVTEPRRLWRRYLVSNARFAFLIARHLWAGPRTIVQRQ
jgi:N-acetylglucosaminyldiphosphoundecaprenol N-acetyl-beta-D-mannosaminyltransferase